MSQETFITIQLVHGGYILHTPEQNTKADSTSDARQPRVEIFTSHGKMMKAVRLAVEEFTLVAKKANDPLE